MLKIVLIFSCLFICVFGQDDNLENYWSTNEQNTEIDDKMTQKVYQIIDHFKNDDPVGIPSLEIPDPISVPDVQQNINVGKLFMSKVKAYGVSQFRIQNVTVEVDRKMEANCGLLFDTLILRGNYSLSSFLARSQGPFVIIISNVVVTANANLKINREGKIRTNEIDADITLAKMNVSFSNLGLLASFFQSFANSAGNVLFDNVKPYILKDAKEKIRIEFDANIDKIIGEFGLIPNSISPVDYIIAESRKKVREMYDPLKINTYENGGIIGIKTYDTVIHGVSSFYRVGDLILQMIDNNLVINLEVGTQEIKGKTSWEMSLAKGMITRRGNVQFSVQYIKIFISLRQPMNLKKQLIINDLQINLGNIQIMSNGLGTFDYVIELFVNVLPNLLRYQIVDAIEKPIVNKLQTIVNRIDIEDLVKELLRQYRNNETLSIDITHFEL
ncbi:hypothetical protein PVAND_009546 [Polypedilum vanderplanki]|uniref:Hemolymph juvenile hormone binding protein n=1 Tax=Polypedilum vanderplanki TaxID=319348 RepID=A0A9J6CDL3_POLVA|nr:hypothetical protein PVAND_009546 [Polypedilum vanderplanki]